MPKNVVVCCDGTANEFAQDGTNVVKLFSTLIHDPDRQVIFYHPGLGTMEPAHELSPLRRRLARLLGRLYASLESALALAKHAEGWSGNRTASNRIETPGPSPHWRATRSGRP